MWQFGLRNYGGMEFDKAATAIKCRLRRHSVLWRSISQYSAAASGRRLFSTKYPTCRQNVEIRVAQLRKYGIRHGGDHHQVPPAAALDVEAVNTPKFGGGLRPPLFFYQISDLPPKCGN